MYYQETKVYYDGSHYIAIPQSEHKVKKGKTHSTEPKITVLERPPLNPPENTEEPKQEINVEKKATRYEIFNEIYSEAQTLPKANRKEYTAEEKKELRSTPSYYHLSP